MLGEHVIMVPEEIQSNDAKVCRFGTNRNKSRGRPGSKMVVGLPHAQPSPILPSTKA